MVSILIPKNINLGVINSQVLILAEQLSQYTDIVLIVEDLLLKDIITHNPKIRLVSYLQKNEVCKVLENSEWIYIRDIFTFCRYYFKRIFSKYTYKIYYDFRGISSEESYYKNKNIIKKFILFKLEQFASKNSDYNGAVSNSLKNYLIEVYKTKKAIHVTPCCILSVEKRKTKPNAEINFVYVGGLSKWQRFDDILALYNGLSKETKSSLTIITKDVHLANEKINELQLLNVTCKSLSQQEVLKDLPNYDFGFLIRDNVIMNNVSSPIKFLEYVSSGVIPIITDGIGDYSKEVRQLNLGLIINEQNFVIDVSKLKQLKNDPDLAIRLYNYSKDYGWSNYINSNHPLLS